MYFETLVVDGLKLVRARDCAKFLIIGAKEIGTYKIGGAFWLTASQALSLLQQGYLGHSLISANKLRAYMAFKQHCKRLCK